MIEAWTSSANCISLNLQSRGSQDLMDSPIVAQLFRRLFRHPTCQSLPSHTTSRLCIHRQRRNASTRPGKRDESHWRPRTDILPPNMIADYNRYPMVTADQLRSRKERPKRVKMLTRDFIEGKTPTSVLGSYADLYCR